MNAIGIDIGATNIRIVLADAKGNVLHFISQQTGGQNAEIVIPRIIQGIQETIAKSSIPVQGIGAGIAGQMDRDKGIIHSSNNLGWKDVPLKSILENQFRMPVAIVNDVQAAAIGEWHYGAGQGTNDLITLFIGTGIGGGIICGGKMVHGATHTAGEFGHMAIIPNGRLCTCGSRGCIEAYAAGWSLAEQAGKKSGKDVAEAYRKNDPEVISIVNEAVKLLSIHATNLCNAFNPSLLILGGGLIEGFPEWVPTIEQTIKKNALPQIAQALRCTSAKLKNLAPALGATRLVMSY